jgi:hypothetical protein
MAMGKELGLRKGREELGRRRGGRGRAAGPRLQGVATSPPRAAAPRAGAGRAHTQGWGSRRRGLVGREREVAQGGEKKRRTRVEIHGGGSPGKKTLAGAEAKSFDCRRFGGSNRRTEHAATKPSMRRTQWYPWIRQTMHGLGVIARRSCRRSWNRPELRRAIPGAKDRIWRKRFVFWNGLDEMKPDMYIYLGFG